MGDKMCLQRDQVLCDDTQTQSLGHIRDMIEVKAVEQSVSCANIYHITLAYDRRHTYKVSTRV